MEEEVQNIVHFEQKYKDIVRNLVQIRKGIPMTQSQIADWLNVDRRKIMDLENGGVNILLLLRYADKLSVDIDVNFKIN